MNDTTTEAERRSTPEWEDMLNNGHQQLRILRGLFKHLPHEPRCKFCISPFAGVGGKVSAVFGFRPSRMNPNFCSRCLEHMPPGGAEVDLAVLFADVRGSTAVGEAMEPAAFARLMNGFYRTATQVLVAHDALIDKLIGDEVMALFVPGITGPAYRRRACEAALALAGAVAHAGGGAPALPLGVAVHAGRAYVGNVGGEGVMDFTALGDTVNTAARLQSFASPGEVVISGPLLASVPGLETACERRTVDIRGRSEPLEIAVLRPG